VCTRIYSCVLCKQMFINPNPGNPERPWAETLMFSTVFRLDIGMHAQSLHVHHYRCRSRHRVSKKPQNLHQVTCVCCSVSHRCVSRMDRISLFIPGAFVSKSNISTAGQDLSHITTLYHCTGPLPLAYKVGWRICKLSRFGVRA